MSDRLPAITHLQFLVLASLASDEQSGRAIRAVIAKYGVRNSAPAFYQMMSRLERDGLVEGRYESIVAGDQSVKERRYRITAAGAKALARTRAFYETAGWPTTARPRWSDV